MTQKDAGRRGLSSAFRAERIRRLYKTRSLASPPRSPYYITLSLPSMVPPPPSPSPEPSPERFLLAVGGVHIEVPRLWTGLWQLSSPAWGTAPAARIRKDMRRHIEKGFVAFGACLARRRARRWLCSVAAVLTSCSADMVCCKSHTALLSLTPTSTGFVLRPAIYAI